MPPATSAGAIIERSSAATILNVSGSTGAGLPAKMYAAHMAIQTAPSPTDERQKAADRAHWSGPSKAPSHSGGVES
jgi:hypothetical protein